jgi:hypothetical protein
MRLRLIRPTGKPRATGQHRVHNPHPKILPLQLILICYLANKKRDRYRKIINNNYITFRSLKIYLRDELRPVRQIKHL